MIQVIIVIYGQRLLHITWPCNLGCLVNLDTDPLERLHCKLILGCVINPDPDPLERLPLLRHQLLHRFRHRPLGLPGKQIFID